MQRSFSFFLLIAATAPSIASAEVTFDWAHIGNAGNAPDPETGFGAVSYNYAISKHEVTNSQYTEFLNAVDPTGANTLSLYNGNMGSSLGGIELQAGNANGSKFVARAGREQNPVNFVTFYHAMRFTNWLHNGQGSGDTGTGAYTIGSGLDEVRSTNARYWIPSEDEWSKAAYHDASSGTAGEYFDYATGSDSVPVSDQPGDNPAAVNYFNDDGDANGFNDGYAVSGSTSFPPSSYPFTDVGAYTDAASPYGTFDQNGNANEWTETVIDFSFRYWRGGSWGSGLSSLRADTPAPLIPAARFGLTDGFRVATVPEPSTLALAAIGGLAMVRRRRKPEQLPPVASLGCLAGAALRPMV